MLFDHGNYDTKGLLLLGFLFCKHKSDQQAAEALWGIINNDLHDTISK
jgi:hypothetical protein